MALLQLFDDQLHRTLHFDSLCPAVDSRLVLRAASALGLLTCASLVQKGHPVWLNVDNPEDKRAAQTPSSLSKHPDWGGAYRGRR
jgi:hypothetical protein